VQELTSISLYKFGSWFGSSTVLSIIEILTISSLVEKQSEFIKLLGERGKIEEARDYMV